MGIAKQANGQAITVDGTYDGAFRSSDWLLTIAVALIWGSSFLWIAMGLDSMEPAAVAFSRVALGAAALWAMPAAREKVDRSAWPTITAIAVAGSAGPAMLFATAQQHVESSVAAMMNSTTPISVVLIGVAITRRRPQHRQVAGILIGFIGVALMTVPTLSGANPQPAGIAMLGLASIGYGISSNLTVGMQQKYGALAIVSRSLIISMVILAIPGLISLSNAKPTGGSIIAVLILGVLGTGFARTLAATLFGRTGANRGSIISYLIPIVAIVLGVLFRNETIELIELAGMATIMVGAWLTTRQSPKQG